MTWVVIQGGVAQDFAENVEVFDLDVFDGHDAGDEEVDLWDRARAAWQDGRLPEEWAQEVLEAMLRRHDEVTLPDSVFVCVSRGFKGSVGPVRLTRWRAEKDAEKVPGGEVFEMRKVTDGSTTESG